MNIKHISDLDISILNQTPRGRTLIKRAKELIGDDGVWVIKAFGINFSLRKLVDYLFRHNLDVFDIEFGSITKIYVCKVDAQRIKNSVVFSLKNEQGHV